MARVIALSPVRNVRSNRMCYSALQFALATLWPEYSYSEDEKHYLITYIRCHLNYPNVTEQTFSEFCERVFLALDALRTSKESSIPEAPVWFNPHFTEGYVNTGFIYKQLQDLRTSVPGYMNDRTVFVKGLYRFTYDNRQSAIRSCRNTLLRLKAHDLLSLLYRTIIFCRFLQ